MQAVEIVNALIIVELQSSPYTNDAQDKSKEL
jgi:hypothetical protein